MLINLYIAFLALIIISLEVAVMRYKILLSQKRKKQRLCESYIRQITQILLEEECREVYPLPNNSTRRAVLAEAIYTTLSHTYGNDYAIIRELTRRYRLDTFLQQRIRWSYGLRRVHILILLSVIPSNYSLAQLLHNYLYSRDYEIRETALLAILAANPSQAISAIATFQHNITAVGIARITGLLRRGLLPIAYEPLLISSNRNLQMLGLSIVGNFGIEIAERRLYKIIDSTTNPDIAYEVIHTLTMLGSSLEYSSIHKKLAILSRRRRKQLCRQVTQSGYSLDTLHRVFAPNETLYSEVIIKSYKRNLICKQSPSTP